MKLRIRDNSIRLRLSQTEVTRLGRSGRVESRTGFPDGSVLSYAVESSPASVAPAAYFASGEVTIRLPESMVLPWVSSEQVSMSGEQSLADGSALQLLVEKDFACLAPRDGEDESDLYPHPESGSARC